jgi:hypothetical protein
MSYSSCGRMDMRSIPELRGWAAHRAPRLTKHLDSSQKVTSPSPLKHSLSFTSLPPASCVRIKLPPCLLAQACRVSVVVPGTREGLTLTGQATKGGFPRSPLHCHWAPRAAASSTSLHLQMGASSANSQISLCPLW